MKTRPLAATLFIATSSLAAFYWVDAYNVASTLWAIQELRTIGRLMTRGAASAPQPRRDAFGRLTSFPGKSEIPCPAQTERAAVLLLIGQSNAGNHAGHRHASAYGDQVVNYFGGKCFVAASPLLGATGQAGESWTLLANGLISSGLADRVVLVPAGVSETSITRWKAGGDLNRMLLTVIDDTKTRYRITQILWHQGESDFHNGTSESEYTRMFFSLVDSIRRSGVDAPIFASVATKCSNSPPWNVDNPIALAQASLVDAERRIFHGANTDAMLDAADRYDDCRLSATGQEKFANAWIEILRKFR